MEDCTSLPGTSNVLLEIKEHQSSESESEEEKRVARKRKPHRNWVVLKQFSNSVEAEKFIKAECIWSRTYTRNTEDGVKKYYRCNKVKKRGPQCDAELCLLYVNNGEHVIAYLTESEHTHDSIGTRNDYGIHVDTKTEINKLVDMRLKPRAILAALRKIKGVKLPTERQLNNYLPSYKAVSEKFTVSLSELEGWIHSHASIPDDANEVFVISSQIIKGDQPSFRFALSTKKLLEIICYTDIVHADTTHKLTWQGFPVLIIGATDKYGGYHPLCIGVTTNELQEDFQVIFQGLKDKAMTIYNHIMIPRVLVCDTSDIQDACSQVFGPGPINRMCWDHVMKSIQKEVDRMVTKHNQKNLLSDLEALQSVTSLEVFGAASRAFVEKWKNESVFMKYFQEEWLEKHTNWFLGMAALAPTSNNGLESVVRGIKDQNLVRERLPLSRFLTVASDIVSQWSHDTTLPEGKSIELDDWTAAYVWANRNIRLIIISSDPISTEYLICNENADYESYSQSWGNFDEFKRQTSSFHKTKLPNTDWQKGSCDCPQFFTKGSCNHILGLAIRLQLVTPPIEARRIHSERKTKRGRPSKYKTALILT